jgi:ferric-dicitrate binding protein FerR (iron transport regulator)
MSESLIDNWLDNELDEESMGQFEEWLREDPDHLQSFFDAVKLQEDLRLHFGATPAMVTLPSRKHKGIRLIGWLSAAAAVLVAVFLVIPHKSDPQPTADPLVWVLDGNPQVEIAKVEPGPNPDQPGGNPFPIPREEWPVETRVTISNNVSTLRWGEDCELRGDPGTNLALRLESEGEPRSIRLNAGSLTVHLAEPAVAVDTLVGDSRIRASQPAVFTIGFSESDSVLSVIRGNVEVRFPDGMKRRVTPGEHVSLP